jgi:small subunit ribosomal protein S8
LGEKTTAETKTLVARLKVKNILNKELIVMVNDTISDMLTRIRNANMVKHQIVEIPASKMSFEIAKILKEEGYINDYESYTENEKKYLLISLKYIGKSRDSVICKIERVSKPGLRVYSNSKNLPKVLDNLGIAIISTSKGVMTNLKAKKLGIGGEVLCSIW